MGTEGRTGDMCKNSYLYRPWLYEGRPSWIKIRQYVWFETMKLWSFYKFLPGFTSFFNQSYKNTVKKRKNSVKVCFWWKIISSKVQSLKFWLTEFINYSLKVPGYLELRQDLKDITEEIETRRTRAQSVLYDVEPKCALYNSPISYTSTRINGTIWNHSLKSLTPTFSRTGRPMEFSPNMKHLYKYFALRRKEDY